MQEIEFLLLRNDIDDLLHCIHGHLLRLYLHHDGIHSPGGGKADDRPREGGAEHEGLALFLGRGAMDDHPDVGDEPHIEHSVRFVDDEDLDLLDHHVTAALEVQEPARRGHDDIGRPGGKLVALLFIIHAAENRNDSYSAILGKLAGLGGDLEGQLPGRSKNQGPGRAERTLFRVGMVDQPGNDGDEKGGGLAGAGLRPAAGILAGEGAGEDFRLDGGAVLEPKIADGVEKRCRQIEILKPGFAGSGRNLELSGIPGIVGNRCGFGNSAGVDSFGPFFPLPRGTAATGALSPFRSQRFRSAAGIASLRLGYR